MKIIQDSVPSLLIRKDGKDLFTIESVQYMDEDESTVVIRCAEYVKEFKRGFMCDMAYNYSYSNSLNKESFEKDGGYIQDLLLVYVNKRWDMEVCPEFEYIFYK